MGRHWLAIVAALAWQAAAAGPARADGLTRTEDARLLAGATVSRQEAIVRGDHRYVGGVAYTIVDAPAAELSAILADVDDWRRFLPSTRSARLVGSVGADPLVEVSHGSGLIHVTYTMRLHREGDVVRFWLEPSRPHDIEDVWGYFRSSRLDGGRTLVSYGILVDMGSGLLRDLFESRVAEAALRVPTHLRELVVARRVADAADHEDPRIARRAR